MGACFPGARLSGLHGCFLGKFQRDKVAKVSTSIALIDQRFAGAKKFAEEWAVAGSYKDNPQGLKSA
jgi:hypothetical protein